MARSGRHQLTRRRTTTGRVLLTAAVLLGVIAVPAGVAAGVTIVRGSLATGVPGSPRAADWIDTAGTDLAIQRVPASEQDPDASAEESLVAATVADLQTFWGQQIPQISSETFAPLRGGVTAIDSAAQDGAAPCVNHPAQISGNAYYCPSDDGIVYDSSALVPVLLDRYGEPGLVAAFAHEFGHAVQARIGPTSEQRTADPTRYPSLLIEAQGDCDAGAFLAWVVAGKAPHIHFGAAAMSTAVGPLLDFADPVTVSRTDATAHGLSLDRLTSVLLGYRQGAAACHAMTMDSLHPTLGAVPVPPGGAAALAIPRYPSTQAVLAAAQQSLARFAGAAVTDRAAANELAAAAPYGQFAQATVLALTEGRALAADRATGADRADVTGGASRQVGISGAGSYAACFAGAWVASVFGTAPAGGLGSCPGDADEGLAAVRISPAATFTDAAAYADGFHGGRAACH
jgi:predicted metalloprotease